jgi:hypothetical protein
VGRLSPTLDFMRSYHLRHSMRTMLAAMSLAFSFPILAASNPPVPTPTEASSQPKTNSAKGNGSANADQRGAKAPPLIIETGPSSASKIGAGQKPEKHEDYSSHEWWLVYLTAALAAITGALALSPHSFGGQQSVSLAAPNILQGSNCAPMSSSIQKRSSRSFGNHQSLRLMRQKSM